MELKEFYELSDRVLNLKAGDRFLLKDESKIFPCVATGKISEHGHVMAYTLCNGEMMYVKASVPNIIFTDEEVPADK